MNPGKLYVFEGPDGCGKTTMARKLEDSMGAIYFAFPGVQPGTLGRHVYDLHHGIFGGVSVPQISLQMLHVAAHIDAIENQIIPALQSGKTVALDRYYWSTYIYGLHNGVDEKFLLNLIALEQLAWGDTKPDVIFLMLRTKPIRPEGKMDDPMVYERWGQLRDLYINSLSYLFNGCDKRVVVNDGSIDDTFRNVMSHIDGTVRQVRIIGRRQTKGWWNDD